ncbi:MAG TPA: type II secretion system F family protein [Gammaproteobacteria bacterium]|nr:type II secretion system F family protein [Gammaproteobacteria bacterium]
MPHYVYRVISEKGHVIDGEASARSAAELSKELESKGYLIQRIRPKVSFGFGAGKAGRREFAVFVRELSALLKAGLTVPEALEASLHRPEDSRLAGILPRLLQNIREGMAFSQSCLQHPGVFDNVFISSIATGEKTGDLVKPLQKYRVYLARSLALQQKVRQAISYPLFLLGVLALALLVLFVFVMPRFIRMYVDFEAELPWPTLLLMQVVQHLPVCIAVLAALAAAGYSGYRFLGASEDGRKRIDAFKERIPVFNALYNATTHARLGRTLGSLLESGMPLAAAMQATVEASANQMTASRLRQAREMVVAGKSLAESLETTAALPVTAVRMIQVGERTGDLGVMFAEVAEFYEEQVDHYLARVMALIEPLLILLIGLFLGGIIIVMYLPIFSMAEVIK